MYQTRITAAELPVERLLGENQDLKTRLARMEEARFAQLADGLAGAGDVILFEEGLSPDGLRRLCDAVLQVCGAAVPAFPGAMGRGINTPSACGAEICAPL